MTSFKLYAGTNVGLRDNNEDNFTVCPDLTKDEWIIPANQQEVIQLGERGCLMVVADGMGGQNAGEVASAIAVETVQRMFSPSVLSANVFKKQDGIADYLKKVIIEADKSIKLRGKNDVSAEGLGSTIVMAWVIDNAVYVAWMGDSRAYSYTPEGIFRLSKDHSYVQQLVDNGKLTEEEAMVNPNSNIITRSLGDMSQKAMPDVAVYPLTEGEVILLCSDGLCGVCTDEAIGNIIAAEASDLQTCKEKLTTAALHAGGSDNITIALLQVTKVVQTKKTSSVTTNGNYVEKNRLRLFINVLFLFFAAFVVGALVFAGVHLLKVVPKEEMNQDDNVIDSTFMKIIHEDSTQGSAEKAYVDKNPMSKGSYKAIEGTALQTALEELTENGKTGSMLNLTQSTSESPSSAQKVDSVNNKEK